MCQTIVHPSHFQVGDPCTTPFILCILCSQTYAAINKRKFNLKSGVFILRENFDFLTIKNLYSISLYYFALSNRSKYVGRSAISVCNC